MFFFPGDGLFGINWAHSCKKNVSSSFTALKIPVSAVGIAAGQGTRYLTDGRGREASYTDLIVAEVLWVSCTLCFHSTLLC